MDPFYPIAYLVSQRRFRDVHQQLTKLQTPDFRPTLAFVQTIRGLFYDLGPNPLQMYVVASMALARTVDSSDVVVRFLVKIFAIVQSFHFIAMIMQMRVLRLSPKV